MDKPALHDRHRLSVQYTRSIRKDDLTVEERNAYERIQKKLMQERRNVWRWRLLERWVMAYGIILLLLTGWWWKDAYDDTIGRLPSSMLHEHVFFPEDGDWFDSIRKHTDTLDTVPFSTSSGNEWDTARHLDASIDASTRMPMNPRVIWIHLEGRSGTQLIRWTEGTWR